MGSDFDKFCEFAKIYLSNLNKLYQNELKPIDKRIDSENLSLPHKFKKKIITEAIELAKKKSKPNISIKLSQIKLN